MPHSHFSERISANESARGFSRAPSTLDDGHDRLHLLPDSAPQLVAGLMHLGAVLLADVPDLGLLILGEVQLLEVGDPVRPPVTRAIRALVLQLLQFLLLLRA